ncbi:MAG: hypothetical protein IJ235_00750 [Eubacterium sp.]|nr:hypothetical protein [Eubacterium sp.]MBR1530521.1 hypothetical protein [Eubacterium sp.]
MKEYEQDYYFEKQNNKTELQEKEKKRVNIGFAVWLICAIISFAVPFAVAIITTILEGFNPFVVIAVVDIMLDFMDIAGYFVLPLLVLASIVQHVIAIVNRIKYPLNEKADTMFRADMIILAISVALIVIGIVSVGIFCNSCLNEMEECG